MNEAETIHALTKSCDYETRIKEQGELIVRQRSEIALLHARLRATELKLHRQYEAQYGLPSLLRDTPKEVETSAFHKRQAE